METIDYQKQAQDFLDRFNIGFRATLSDSKAANWEPSGHHYRVTLSKPASGVKCTTSGRRQNPTTRITFDYWGSLHDMENLRKASAKLQNMQLQMQNTEPHLRINLRARLQECEEAVKACHPSAYDVLAAISGDTMEYTGFKEWCGEYGYETDSIKALQTYRRCDRFAKRLREFFTAEEIEALQEIQ